MMHRSVIRFLSGVSLILITLTTARAQCTPDPQYTKPGIYPDSTVNLPMAYVGTPYAETITFVIPKDTVLGSFTIPIDSVVLKGFSGFPAGFIYTCNPSKCSWPGGSKGCVEITGTATTGQEGTYPLLAYVESFAGGITAPQRDTVKYLRIVVNAPQNVEEFDSHLRLAGPAYPNPADTYVELEVFALKGGQAHFELFDVPGRRLESREVPLTYGKNHVVVATEELPDGLYLFRMEMGGFSNSGTLVVRHR